MLPQKRRVYVETYGCQMNLADTEVVLSLLSHDGYQLTGELSEADLVLVNTCRVREQAEKRIYGRLGEFKRLKREKPGVIVGVIGQQAKDALGVRQVHLAAV